MATSSARFVWYELMTTDLAAARAFYSKVVGWEPKNAEMPGTEYWLFNMGEKQMAGLMDLPEESRKMGTPSSWIGYVGVESVDAAEAKSKASGGRTYQPPTDIPGVGRFAVLADPTGAVISLFQSSDANQMSPLTQQDPGGVGWHELYSGDVNAVWPYYEGLFGWQKLDSMDMGEMGTYQIFGVGDQQIGGMMNKPPEVPASYWNYYFNVGNIDEAAERVKSAGGTILVGPIEVPGGGWVIQAMDPQGAAFSLFGNR
jgi:uncharacterized protein